MFISGGYLHCFDRGEGRCLLLKVANESMLHS